MSWETKPMLLKNGLPIPQYYDPVADEWKPYTNADLKAVRSELVIVKNELQTIKENQLSGDQKVQLSGSNMELFGADDADRPAADTVPVGATYMAVNTGKIWQSNGTSWVVM
jgi:hypothetical protein